MSEVLPSMAEILDRVKKVEREKTINAFLLKIKSRKLYLEQWQWNEIKKMADEVIKEQRDE